jgi:hypothetical protein
MAGPPRTTEQSLDSGRQLTQRERLREIVVGAQLQAEHLVELLVLRCQEHDRHLEIDRPDAPEQFDAVRPGHDDIQDREVGSRAPKCVPRRFAVVGRINLVPLGRKGVAKILAEIRLIVGDEDARPAIHGGDCIPADASG